MRHSDHDCVVHCNLQAHPFWQRGSALDKFPLPDLRLPRETAFEAYLACSQTFLASHGLTNQVCGTRCATHTLGPCVGCAVRPASCLSGMQITRLQCTAELPAIREVGVAQAYGATLQITALLLQRGRGSGDAKQHALRLSLAVRRNLEAEVAAAATDYAGVSAGAGAADVRLHTPDAELDFDERASETGAQLSGTVFACLEPLTHVGTT